MDHEVLKKLGATNYHYEVNAPIYKDFAEYTIEWTITDQLYRGKILPPVIYYIYLYDDRAVLSCFDISSDVFPYCDPKFPDNLLELIDVPKNSEINVKKTTSS